MKEEVTLGNLRNGKSMTLKKIEDRGVKTYNEFMIYLEWISPEQNSLLVQKIEDNVPLIDYILCMPELFGCSLRLRVSDDFKWSDSGFIFWDANRIQENVTKWVEEVRKELPDGNE